LTYDLLKQIKPAMRDSNFTLADLESLDREAGFPIAFHYMHEQDMTVGCEFVINAAGDRRFAKIPVKVFNTLPESPSFDTDKRLTQAQS
jgi:hypothetical protein